MDVVDSDGGGDVGAVADRREDDLVVIEKVV
jgi:hypothetical protein